jgi:hypothetical protein
MHRPWTLVRRASNFAFDRRVTVDLIGGLNLGLPGQCFDAESGLWQNGNRQYDSRWGGAFRWWTFGGGPGQKHT